MKPILRVIEDDFGRAYRIAKKLIKEHGQATWFQGVQLHKQKDNLAIKVCVSKEWLNKTTVEPSQIEGIYVYPVCELAVNNLPEERDFWI